MLERIRKLLFTRLETIAFIVGMAVLTFELTAARIIAPYLGDTMYTWTSIIGVILAALAFGYAKGGALADKRQKESDVVLFLTAAAVLIAATNLCKDFVLSELVNQALPMQLQAFTASLYLFAAPTFMLGLVSPYLARLSISTVATSGRHLSRVDAAGTTGSLVGTFLTGYFLFGMVGTRHLLTCLAVGLLLATCLVKTRQYVRWRITLLVLIVLGGVFAPGPVLAGFVKEIDTAYSRIIIRDVSVGGRQVRAYQTDSNGLQSGIYTDGLGGQPFSYIRGFSYASGLRPAGEQYLVIGGGAFTFPEYLARKEPKAVVDTVEIDRQLPAISRSYFNFQQPANLHIVYEDGRTFLNSNQAAYDIVFLDAFSASVPPFQLLTHEAVLRINRSLQPDGVVAANIISAIKGQDSEMIRHIYSTYAAVFPHVVVYPVEKASPELQQNLLLLASKKPFNGPELDSLTAAFPEFANMVKSRIALSFDQTRILTDDYAPVDQLAR